MKNYFLDLLIAFDQLANTLLGGYPDETVSLRAAREKRINNKAWACVLCKVLDWFQKDHCALTEESKHNSVLYRNL